MAFRADISVDWTQSPRIITVASPSTEVILQDLIDTLRVLEALLQNLDEDQIITAAGKESLGGGTSVGITATLLNALLAFEARLGPTYVQCSVSGGNLVSLQADLLTYYTTPISPTAFTQVVTTASSSATTQSQAQLEHTTFSGGVTVDLVGISAIPGVNYPAGTPSSPSANFADARTIAITRGFSKFLVVGDAVLDTGTDFTNFGFMGQGQNLSTFTLHPDATFINSSFLDATIGGTLDGDSHVEDCIVDGLNFVSGVLQNCLLAAGTIVLGGNSDAHLIGCSSGVVGSGTPTIDMNGSGQNLAIRDYNGGIKIQNKNGADAVSIDMNSGHIVIDSTVSAGDIVVRGNAKLTDNHTGTAVVNSADLLQPSRVNQLQFLIESQRDGHTATGKLWYWNPVGGSDSFVGTTPETAVATFAQAHSLATDWGHDVVVCIPGNPAGITVVTEPIEVTKNWLFVRGPGVDFVVRPATTNGDGSLVNVSGVIGSELSGFVLDGTTTPGTGITMQSNSGLIKNLKIANITGDGIAMAGSQDNEFENIRIVNTSGNGILLDDNIGLRAKSVFIRNATTGLKVTATTPGSGGTSNLEDMAFLSCNVGIDIGTNVTNMLIRDSVRFHQCPTRLIDSGTLTHDEAIISHGIVRTGFAQGAGLNGNQIQLDANASSVNGAYDPAVVTIAAGAGMGQTRLIYQYTGADKMCTVDRGWKVLPDATSEFVILPDAGREHVNEGLAQGGTLNTITLNSAASSSDDAYVGQTVFIRSGTGDDQTGSVESYAGTTKVATMVADWHVIPDTTSAYAMLPSGVSSGGSGFTVEQATQLAEIHGQLAREIWYDATVVNGNGYQQSPYSVLNEAIDDAELNRLSVINTFSNILLTKKVRNVQVKGIGLPIFDANGFDLKGTQLWQVQFTGIAPIEPFIIQQSRVLAGAGLNGHAELCTFEGDCSLTGDTHLVNCLSNKEGGGYVNIDVNGFGLQVTNWHRSLGISVLTTGEHTIEMYGGQLHLGAGCIGGTIYLRGNYSLAPDDQSAGTILIDQTEESGLTIAENTQLMALPSASEIAGQVLNTVAP